MTSGGDTDNDLIHACTLSAKYQEENVNAVSHTKPLKNHRLQNPLERRRAWAHFLSVQFSTVFALSFSNCSPYGSARKHEKDRTLIQVLLD